MRRSDRIMIEILPMELLEPQTAEELAEALGAAARAGSAIDLCGADTKRRMAPGEEAAVRISTRRLNRIVEYEPRDLTISVEAGLPFAGLSQRLAADGLMLPLDPPFFGGATVGGVVAAAACGPRRRQYGGVRDVVIGMRFATLEGKLVETGGMVVKNAAGFDMAKLMIGSMGTLAAIAAVNFRLAPIPPHTATFVERFDTLEEACRRRDEILRGVLQPAAIDLLNAAGAARVGLEGFCLALQVEGNAGVIGRYRQAFPRAEVLEGEEERALWERVREFVPGFLGEHAGGGTVRISTTIQGAGAALERLGDRPALARAGSGVVYGCFTDCEEACRWTAEAAGAGWRAVVEFVGSDGCAGERWPAAGSDFGLMERIKRMFDPEGLLNRGKLYGRI